MARGALDSASSYTSDSSDDDKTEEMSNAPSKANQGPNGNPNGKSTVPSEISISKSQEDDDRKLPARKSSDRMEPARSARDIIRQTAPANSNPEVIDLLDSDSDDSVSLSKPVFARRRISTDNGGGEGPKVKTETSSENEKFDC